MGISEQELGEKMRARSNYCFAIIAAMTILLTAVAYWPVIHGGFVWDDVVDLHDKTWLRQGSEWKHFVFRDYNYWTNYFRPLGVALLTLQVRLFSDAPEPMHAVSLGLHLINTVLVGIFSWLCLGKNTNDTTNKYFFVASVLFYGLNPVLIEPVAWISCQFDLLLTTLLLMGLIVNSIVINVYRRAAMLAALFFLAACTKESAVAYPLIVLVYEWLLLNKAAGQVFFSRLLFLIRQSWLVYVAIFIAGIVYLAFRHWALGKLVEPAGSTPMSVLGHLQEVSYLYLHYWKSLFWVANGMSPIHAVDTLQFNALSFQSLLIDTTAAFTVFTGFYLALRRSTAIGCMILVVTVALLPVLHITSTNFDSSLYHERYGMTALASLCPMLPLLLSGFPKKIGASRVVYGLLAIVIVFWLVCSLVIIRTTLPLWASNTNLWRWAAFEDSKSIEAKDSLLSAYIDEKDYVHAHSLIERLIVDKVDCTNCMLNAAILDVSENKPEAAAKALDKVKNSKQILVDKKMFSSYLLTTGQTLVLQGKLSDAEEILQAAITDEPFDAQPRISLAVALGFDGKKEKARITGEAGISLLPASEQPAARENIDRAILSGRAAGLKRIDSHNSESLNQ